MTTPTSPVVTDACGKVLTPADTTVTDIPECDGSVNYIFHYRDCFGHTHQWTFTYVIETPDLVLPAAGASTIACVGDTVKPVPSTVTDACGREVVAETNGLPEVDLLANGHGTVTYYFVYRSCSGQTFPWQYVYTVAPEAFQPIADKDTTVYCLSDVFEPATPTVEVCGNASIFHLDSTVHHSVGCGEQVYHYSYKVNDTTHTWKYTYHISPETFALPADSIVKVQCLADVAMPVPPVVTNNCHDIVTPVLTANDTVFNGCEGTVTFSYTYNDCTNAHASVWKLTYQIKDTIKPVINTSASTWIASMQASRTHDALNNCVYTVPDLTTMVQNSTSDNCTSVATDFEITQSPAAGTTVTAEQTVTVTAKDLCGRISAAATVTITVPDAITVTTPSSSWNYNGQSHSAPYFSLTSGTVSVMDQPSGTTVTLPNGDQATVTVTGVVTEVAEGDVPNTAVVVVNDASGNDVTCWYTVNKNEGGLKVIESVLYLECPTDGDTTRVYDGTPLVPQVTAHVTSATTDEVTITYSVDGGAWSTTPPSVTHVSEGTKTVKVRAVTTSQVMEECQFTMHVTCRKDTLISADGGKTYDGEALTSETVTMTGDGFLTGETPTFSNFASLTNAGSVSNTFDYAFPSGVDESDYCITVINGTLSVSKKTFSIAFDSTKAYDGTVFYVTADQLHVTGLLDGHVLATGEMWTESANVGEYENNDGSFQALMAAGVIYKSGFSIVDASSDVMTANYMPGFDVKLSIAPKAITITAASDTKPYDGTSLTNSGYSITTGELATTDHLASCDVAGSQLCKGSIENIPSGAVIKNGDDEDVTTNYAITYVNGALTVTSATGFICPPTETFQLVDRTQDEMEVTLSGTPTVMNVAAGHYTVTNNLASLNPMSVGTHTVTWSLLDDCGNVVATCDQTVIVEIKPCTGVTWQGYTYNAVSVGSQCWLTENMRWATGNHSAYGDDADNVDKFGYLYTWYTAVGVAEGADDAVPQTRLDDNGQPYVQGICPDGWGVGSAADFDLLNLTAGSTGALKDVSTEYWLSGYEGTLPNTGFNARGSGWYSTERSRYEDLMTGSHIWHSDVNAGSTIIGSSTASSSTISYYCDDILNTDSRKTDRLSVRCIRKNW